MFIGRELGDRQQDKWAASCYWEVEDYPHFLFFKNLGCDIPSDSDSTWGIIWNAAVGDLLISYATAQGAAVLEQNRGECSSPEEQQH